MEETYCLFNGNRPGEPALLKMQLTESEADSRNNALEYEGYGFLHWFKYEPADSLGLSDPGEEG